MAGVIYVWDIMEMRIKGTALKNLAMFQKALPNRQSEKRSSCEYKIGPHRRVTGKVASDTVLQAHARHGCAHGSS